MSALRGRIAAIAHALLAGFHVPGIFAVLVCATLAWSLAYQVKATYVVDVGGASDDAFVSGFNAKERNSELTYRWSGSRSTVLFTGIGNEPVVVTLRTVGYRPQGPPPEAVVTIRGQQFQLQTRPEPHEDSFLVERGSRSQGDVEIVVETPAFSPEGDPRRLGLIVDRVTVAPAGMGLSPVVIPPVSTVAVLLLSLLVFYVVCLLTVRSAAVGLLLASVIAVAFLALVIWARPELGFLARSARPVLAWSLALAASVALLAGQRTSGPGEWRATAMAWGRLAFVLAFALRYGGVTYPQFLTSDIMLHVHNIQAVLRGDFLVSERLPDGTPVPYPPALYVLLAPVAAALGSGDAALRELLKWAGCLLDSTTSVALAWAGSRLRLPRAGAAAGMLYAVSPAGLVLLSAGNYSNIFGQTALNWALLASAVYLVGSWSRKTGLLALFALFMLTVLGHYGIMLAAVAVLALFAAWTLLSRLRGASAPEAWRLLTAFAVSLVAAFGFFYVHFAGQMWDQWSAVVARVFGARSDRPASGSDSGGVLDFALRRANWLGRWIALAAPWGLGGVARRGSGWFPLVACWLAASGLFALLDQMLGDTIRWYYLAGAPLALVAGRFLASLAARRGAARVLAALVLASATLEFLTFWVGDLILTRYHLP